MSRCPGLHCDGCGRGGALAAILAAGAAAIAAVAAFAEEILVAIGAAAAAVLALAVLAAVRAWRRGWRPSLDPVVAYTPLPEPETRRALPPQQFHLHLHGPLTPEQLAEIAAMRQNAVQAFNPDWRKP